MKLLLEKICTYGTAWLGGKDWPSKFKNLEALRLRHGKSCNLHDAVTAVVWHDKCDVFLLCTNSDLMSDEILEKKVRRDKEKCPVAAANYTRYTRDWIWVNCKNIRVLGVCFHFILNVGIVNSSVLYNITSGPLDSAHWNGHLTFRITCCSSWLNFHLAQAGKEVCL